MSEQAKTGERQGGRAAAPPPAKAVREVSDPREVEALLLARIHQVTARKQEMLTAIDGVHAIALQLARSYRLQREAIEQLSERVRALEAVQAAPCGAVQ